MGKVPGVYAESVLQTPHYIMCCLIFGCADSVDSRLRGSIFFGGLIGCIVVFSFNALYVRYNSYDSYSCLFCSPTYAAIAQSGRSFVGFGMCLHSSRSLGVTIYHAISRRLDSKWTLLQAKKVEHIVPAKIKHKQGTAHKAFSNPGIRWIRNPDSGYIAL